MALNKVVKLNFNAENGQDVSFGDALCFQEWLLLGCLLMRDSTL
jgi:hypothetical protein